MQWDLTAGINDGQKSDGGGVAQFIQLASCISETKLGFPSALQMQLWKQCDYFCIAVK